MQIETVRIASPVSDDNPHGYIVINKADLTKAHVFFDEASRIAPATPRTKKTA